MWWRRSFQFVFLRSFDVTNELEPQLRGHETDGPRFPLPAVAWTTEPRTKELRAATLREALRSVVGYLKAQLELRHNLYHQTDAMIARIAAALVHGPDGSATPTIESGASDS